MINFILIILLLLLAVYWSSAMKTREIAFTFVSNHCHQLDLMLLDEYVALSAQWLKRDNDGKLKVWRTYQFEFSSTGDERYQGEIIMLGLQVLSIELEPYKI